MQVGGDGLGEAGALGLQESGQVCWYLEGAAAETGPHWPACHTLDYCAKESLSDLPRCQPCSDTGRVLLASAEQDPRTIPRETGVLGGRGQRQGLERRRRRQATLRLSSVYQEGSGVETDLTQDFGPK